MQFSVIIPARNEEELIAAAIMSALTQAEVTVEVIVVDDGSTDRTFEIVKDARKTDDRVVLLRNTTSAGVSVARNQGIDTAKGDWIALLDADDEFLPGRLCGMLQEAERRSLNMFADNLKLRSEAGDDLGLAFLETELHGQNPVSLDVFLLHDIPYRQKMGVGYCKPIIKRDFIKKNNLRFRQGIKCAEDFLFYTECLMAGARLGFSKSPSYLYTVRPDGHGTAFNLEASRVNRMIMELSKKSVPSAQAILKMRQRELDYTAFQKSLRAGKYSEALTSFRRLPLSLMMRHAARVVRNRARRMRRSS